VKQAADEKIAALNTSGAWGAPVVTQVLPFEAFFRAEDYHQGYFRHNPGQGHCQIVVSPKVSKFRAHFRGETQVLRKSCRDFRFKDVLSPSVVRSASRIVGPPTTLKDA
jgi:hypothetical protein